MIGGGNGIAAFARTYDASFASTNEFRSMLDDLESDWLPHPCRAGRPRPVIRTLTLPSADP